MQQPRIYLLVAGLVWLAIGCNQRHVLPATSTPTTVPTITSFPTITPIPVITPTSLLSAGSSPVVTGTVILNNGICCAGGTAGDQVKITADFTATSNDAPITEMRFVDSYTCSENSEIQLAEWEDFRNKVVFDVSISINWIGYYVQAQFRDARGNMSPILCDDIGIEGSPP